MPRQSDQQQAATTLTLSSITLPTTYFQGSTFSLKLTWAMCPTLSKLLGTSFVMEGGMTERRTASTADEVEARG